jgi:hypothetical protein
LVIGGVRRREIDEMAGSPQETQSSKIFLHALAFSERIFIMKRTEIHKCNGS